MIDYSAVKKRGKGPLNEKLLSVTRAKGEKRIEGKRKKNQCARLIDSLSRGATPGERGGKKGEKNYARKRGEGGG